MRSLVPTSFLLLAASGFAYCQVEAQVALSNGIQLSIATHSNNGTPIALMTSLEPASGDSFYRIFRDQNQLAVFAYELEVSRSSNGERFLVRAKPATETFAERFPNADGGKPTPTLSTILESPPLGSGERFVIPIPTAPELGQILADTVQIEMTQSGEVTAGTPVIRFSGLKVSIQGRPVSTDGPAMNVEGRYVMFYLPGHGGYFFSASASEPAPFLNVGLVDGKHLSFTIDNEMYDCTASEAILVRATSGQLSVYHDPNYKPAGNWTKSDLTNQRDEFFTAASDSLKWWVRPATQP